MTSCERLMAHGHHIARNQIGEDTDWLEIAWDSAETMLIFSADEFFARIERIAVPRTVLGRSSLIDVHPS
jgi:hypothetical protein